MNIKLDQRGTEAYLQQDMYGDVYRRAVKANARYQAQAKKAPVKVLSCSGVELFTADPNERMW